MLHVGVGSESSVKSFSFWIASLLLSGCWWCFCQSPMTLNVKSICCGSNCRRRRHFFVMYTHFSNSRRPIDRFASDYYFTSLVWMLCLTSSDTNLMRSKHYSASLVLLYQFILRHEFNKQTKYGVGLNRMQLHENTNEIESESCLRFGHLSDDLFNESISNRMERPSRG